MVIKLAWKLNFVSHPNTIFVAQKKPVAYLGGIAILLNIAFNTLLNPFFINNDSSSINNILLISVFFTIIGLVDDWVELKPLGKLLAQTIGVIFTLYLGNYFLFTTSAFLNYFFSGFILLFTINAFNLVDVSDGLLSVIFLSIISFFYLTSNNDFFILLLGISITCFLFFNRPEAKIYLGDSGSHLLGALAYILSIDYIDDSFQLNKIIPLILVFSVIIFEFIILFYRRSKQNLSVYKGSPDHFSILLRKASWSKQEIMITAFIVNLFFAILAYISISYSLALKLILLLLTISTFFLFGYFINKLSNEEK